MSYPPALKEAWRRGLTVFLKDGKPVVRADSGSLTADDQAWLKRNREMLIKALQPDTRPRIDGAKFYGKLYTDKFGD